jgi:hypothetical protein
MFEKDKNDLVGAIKALRLQVTSRGQGMAATLQNAYLDFEDRLSQVEKKLIGELDGHALDVESTVRELTNMGEQVANAASSGSGTSTQPSEAAHLHETKP